MRVSALVVLMLALGPSAAHAVGLPDSGQDLCDNGANTLATCSAVNAGDAATYPRQDGRFGRDAKASAGTLVKVGSGAGGFDYTKIANNGTDLSAGAALGSNPAEWACTRDNVTGLTWEVKTSDGGIRDWGWTYTWYSSDGVTNGGNVGSQGGNTCNATLPASLCNTQAFVTAVKAAALCSYTDWRLPTYRELSTLVHFGALNPAIDTTHFPNTRGSFTWSASSSAGTPEFAWFVYFYTGYSGIYSKATASFVRLVRGGQF
jgi:hypothetical protein